MSTVHEVISEQLRGVYAVAQREPGLRLLVLFGSRARGDQHDESDWDFAFLGDIDILGLRGRLTDALATDSVDLVDLSRASGLLRFRVASHGLVVFQQVPGTFDDFAIEAALYWYDVEPIVRKAHAELIAGL